MTDIAADALNSEATAELVSALGLYFPFPKQERITDALFLVHSILHDQVWVEALGKSPAEGMFRRLIQSLIDEALSDPLLPLLFYLRFIDLPKYVQFPNGSLVWLSQGLFAPRDSLNPQATNDDEILADALKAAATAVDEILTKHRFEVAILEGRIGKDKISQFSEYESDLRGAALKSLCRLEKIARRDPLYIQIISSSKIKNERFFGSGLLVNSISPSLDVKMSADQFLSNFHMDKSKRQFLLEQSSGEGLVRVYFATDRKRQPTKPDRLMFSDERSSLSWGWCDISIPENHRTGRLERPSVWKLQFRPNRNQHITVQTGSVTSWDDISNHLRVELSKRSDAHALLFVHGYNTSFEGAALRTAQISFDLGFDGATFFFSWPSRAKVLPYTQDEQSIEKSRPNLTAMIEKILSHTDIDRICLIAHSMGNRALFYSLKELSGLGETTRAKIGEIILAAPDIDADVFLRDIAPEVAGMGVPITLYASKNDRALKASRRVHRDQRAGDTEPVPVLHDAVETIDASNCDTSMLGHAYVGSKKTILSDLSYIVKESLRAEKRFGLDKIELSPNGKIYWRIRR